jgi:hypothetical protein
MADHLELNIETLGRTLRKQASGFRRLADDALTGDCRTGLLELALDYDRQAATLEDAQTRYQQPAGERRRCVD